MSRLAFAGGRGVDQGVDRDVDRGGAPCGGRVDRGTLCSRFWGAEEEFSSDEDAVAEPSPRPQVGDFMAAAMAKLPARRQKFAPGGRPSGGGFAHREEWWKSHHQNGDGSFRLIPQLDSRVDSRHISNLGNEIAPDDRTGNHLSGDGEIASPIRCMRLFREGDGIVSSVCEVRPDRSSEILTDTEIVVSPSVATGPCGGRE